MLIKKIFPGYWPMILRRKSVLARLICNLRLWSFVALLNVCDSSFAEDDFQAGPLFAQFPLTLDSGHRTEAMGPFFYDQQKGSEKIWAIPPLFSHKTDPAIEFREDDFLYPLLTYEFYGKEYRWQFFQLLSFSGG